VAASCLQKQKNILSLAGWTHKAKTQGLTKSHAPRAIKMELPWSLAANGNIM